MSRNEINVPDPEVVPIAKRRRFTAKEKLRILEEAEASTVGRCSQGLANIGADRGEPGLATQFVKQAIDIFERLGA